MKYKHSEFLKRIEQRILDEQKLFFIKKKTGETILTTKAYRLFSGIKNLGYHIDWYEEKRPQYTRHANLQKFMKTHIFIGEI